MQQGKRPWRVALGALLICGCGTTDDPGIESEADGEGEALAEHNDDLLFPWRRWRPSRSARASIREGGGSASVRARRPRATCEAEQCEVALWAARADGGRRHRATTF
jgi:hypothetical protein